MARDRSVARNVAELVAARSILAGASVLPAGAIRPLARVLGSLLHVALPGRRRVVADNVRLAYAGAPDVPDPDALGRAALSNLCLNFLEVAKAAKWKEDFARGLSFKEPTRWDELRNLLAGGPVVFAVSHFAAFQMCVLAAGALGIRVTTLWRPYDNPYLARWMERTSKRFGQKLVGNRGSMRELFRDLREGRSVALLIDLNHRGRGVFVDFYGRPAATAVTAARLAQRAGRPLVPIFLHRTSRPQRFEIDLGDPVWPAAERAGHDEDRRLLQEATAQIESRVRARPDQWLWTHRRWKTRPPATLEGARA